MMGFNMKQEQHLREAHSPTRAIVNITVWQSLQAAGGHAPKPDGRALCASLPV